MNDIVVNEIKWLGTPSDEATQIDIMKQLRSLIQLQLHNLRYNLSEKDLKSILKGIINNNNACYNIRNYYKLNKPKSRPEDVIPTILKWNTRLSFGLQFGKVSY